MAWCRVPTPEVVRAVAVAGVGSSALGAAAFPRNVADALGAPVAAVVSGCVLADLAAKALGGFFLFGAVNAVRHQFNRLDRLRESISVAGTEDQGDSGGAGLAFGRHSDTQSVRALSSHRAISLKMLIGHARGNLVARVGDALAA